MHETISQEENTPKTQKILFSEPKKTKNKDYIGYIPFRREQHAQKHETYFPKNKINKDLLGYISFCNTKKHQNKSHSDSE
jgi:hypothetical protein